MPSRFAIPARSANAYHENEGGWRFSTARWQAGLGSEYIANLSDLIAKNGPLDVALYCRVSSQGQVENKNLIQQLEEAWTILDDLQCNVVRIFIEAAHSSIRDIEFKPGFPRNRCKFLDAIDYARKHNLVLVAPSRDRFLRGSFLISGKAETEHPVIADYLELKRLTHGVTLATICHPDDEEVRSKQIKRGQAARKAKGGRPPAETKGPGYMKRRRILLKEMAYQLHLDGLSYRDVTSRINSGLKHWPKVSIMTVYNWIKQAKRQSV